MSTKKTLSKPPSTPQTREKRTVIKKDCEITSTYINNKAQGKTHIKFTDDHSYAITYMKKGRLHGKYSLYKKDNTKVFSCPYKNGKKNGKGFEILNGGCRIDGSWKDNDLHGKVIFTYPDGMRVEGEVEEGEFVEGAYFTKKGRKIKNLKVDMVDKEEMPEFKMDKDPYESKYLEVKEVEGKGEGLFAKRAINKNKLCSLYSGMLVPHYKVDRRRWEFNNNTIEADPKYSIDVPDPYHKLDNYCASLGHKANHSFGPNSKYVFLFHPKFGDIMSVVSIKDIKKGEEILVNYGYSEHAKGPKWYREARKEYRDQKKKAEKAQNKRKRAATSKETKTSKNSKKTHKRRKIE